MANERIPRHGHTHEPGGPDPVIGGGVYKSTIVVTDPVDHVLFDAFPAGLVMLELAWRARLDYDGGVDNFLGILMNGDAEANEVLHDETEYHWNVGIPNDAHYPLGSIISMSDNDYFNDYGVLSWIPQSAETFGAIRFPDYVNPDLVPVWHGHGSAGGADGGDSTNPFVCGGGKQDYSTPLTAIALISTPPDDTTARQNFASGSRFTLTGY